MYRLLIIIFLSFNSVFAQNIDESKTKNINLFLGINKEIQLDFAADPRNGISIANEAVVGFQYIQNKKEIVLIPKKAGNSNITVRNLVGDIRARYKIKVTANDQSIIVQKLKELLGDIEGLEIGIIGGSVFVGGQIVVPSAIGRITLVLREKFRDSKILNFVELSPQSQLLVAKKMQDEIQRAGLPNVTVRVVNKIYWLEGSSPSGGDVRALKIATAYMPERIIPLAERENTALQTTPKNAIENFIVIQPGEKKEQPLEKLIKITAQFVELTKNFNRTFGFNWSPSLNADGGQIQFGRTTEGGVTTNSSGTLSGVISNLFPQIEAAKNAGYARLVQSAVVITKNKKPTVISKSEVQNITFGEGESARVEKLNAKFELSVNPTVLKNENIDLNIDLSVEFIVQSTVLSNKVKTNLFVKSKESAVVGGIVTNREDTDYDRGSQPGTGNIFSIERSKRFISAKSQFVVFITPEIILSASEGTEKIKKKFRKRSR